MQLIKQKVKFDKKKKNKINVFFSFYVFRKNIED